jgi:hypothetical protein
MKPAVSLIAVALIATGCATSSGPRPSETDVATYCESLYADSRIDPVRDKILLPITFGAGQPIGMLANRAHPTADETEAIRALSRAWEGCNDRWVEVFGPMPSYRISSRHRVSESLAELYAGELTYGGFAKDMLYIGERDQLAREDLEAAIRAQQAWQSLQDNDNN